MKLEDIRRGCRLVGILGKTPVEILAANAVEPDAIEVIYREPGSSGRLGEKIVRREDEVSISEVFTFLGNPHLFQLALEAQRMWLAPNFIPYIVLDTSKIDPLPHQITAVYDIMLKRHPLRFLLADDPGAGKTVMAGLLIKELFLRRTLRRCLVIAPGSLVEQWQEELRDKFDLNFVILPPARLAPDHRNPLDEHPLLIARRDTLKRSEWKERIESAQPWDLVVCDEAHRMSVIIHSGRREETENYKLGKLVRQKSHHFLLMTATPHNGKEEEFQEFMGLLDNERFGLLDPYRIVGRPWNEVDKIDPSNMMRRMMKEDLCRFDNSPLFPERKSCTAAYNLSPSETELYKQVTQYVREEMRRLERLELNNDNRRQSVGFALQILQRRLASSHTAIHESLKRRRTRLEEYLQKEQEKRTQRDVRLEITKPDLGPIHDDDWFDDMPEDDEEEYNDMFVNRATAAQTIEELELEVEKLGHLVSMANRIRSSGEDTKWQQLCQILNDPSIIEAQSSTRRKIVIFTEWRDTMQHLNERISELVGEGVCVEVHGGLNRNQRRESIAKFNFDPTVCVMLATDAAGEGVNLHHGSHLMVNYDLPWNPNRLEQRFGRIHRIGQTKVCHLWNLVAENTREGKVYKTLLDKLEVAREALGGKVYDVIGELFDSKQLGEIFMEAVCFDESTDERTQPLYKIESVTDIGQINEIMKRNDLTNDKMDASTALSNYSDMKRKMIHRLHPFSSFSFFKDAFEAIGGGTRIHEDGSFEITNVPQQLHDFHNRCGHSGRLSTGFIKFCFDTLDENGSSVATHIALGHPLMDALVGFVLNEYKEHITRGAVFVDELNRSEKPRVMVLIRSTIHEGQSGSTMTQKIPSQKLLRVWLDDEDHIIESASLQCLLGRELFALESEQVSEIMKQKWLGVPLNKRIENIESKEVKCNHIEEVSRRQNESLDQEAAAVKTHVLKKVERFEGYARAYSARRKVGKEKFSLEMADALRELLEARLADIDRRRVYEAETEICGVALVIPKCLLCASFDDNKIDRHYSLDLETRKEVEERAIQTVMNRETELGRNPKDVSGQELGYDIECTDSHTQEVTFIIVKGRRTSEKNICITKTEMMAAHNARDACTLAVVLVEGSFPEEQIYLQDPAKVIGPPPEFQEYFRNVSVGEIRIAANQSSRTRE